MAADRFRFEHFLLDLRDRQLRRDGAPVELNARYLDALALLVAAEGRLVSKDRFLEEVWRGVPVTDEALTQCIRTLRRQLGDDAARPRFIETVPKHGYRFIAPVERLGDGQPPAPAPVEARPGLLSLTAAGMAGGGAAGVFAGLFYGFAGISPSPEPGMGGVSVVLVLICLSIFAGVVGGGAVGAGLAGARLAAGRTGPWSVLGGALAGLAVGGVAKLLGLDAFNLLFGHSPGDITGAPEGALLGGAVGLGLWLGRGRSGRSIAAAGLASAAAGMLATLAGGRLMGGSLDLVARSFPGSRLRFDQIGALFGEPGFGPVSQLVTGGIEGLLFGVCMAAAITAAPRRFRRGWA